MGLSFRRPWQELQRRLTEPEQTGCWEPERVAAELPLLSEHTCPGNLRLSEQPCPGNLRLSEYSCPARCSSVHSV